MISVSAGRTVHGRRRVHLAVGTAAAAIAAAATVGVGALLIPVGPPASDTTPFCSEPYECVQPGADQLVPPGFEPLAAYGAATWNSGMPS
jgi:hypothetical protein